MTSDDTHSYSDFCKLGLKHCKGKIFSIHWYYPANIYLFKESKIECQPGSYYPKSLFRLCNDIFNKKSNTNSYPRWNFRIEMSQCFESVTYFQQPFKNFKRSFSDIQKYITLLKQDNIRGNSRFIAQQTQDVNLTQTSRTSSERLMQISSALVILDYVWYQKAPQYA